MSADTELSYWTSRLRDLMRERFHLELHPIQTDTRLAPPREYVAEIQDPSKADPDVFVASGCRSMRFYLDELHDHGVNVAELSRILEFGVGLGRLIRHLFPFKAKLYGCDATARALAYTKSTLGHRVECTLVERTPPLPYADAFFDFVYANSVFTHIQMPLAREWIGEMARIVRPGGSAIVSVFDANQALRHLSDREVDLIERGDGYYGWGDRTVLESFAFMTPARLRDEWQRHFRILELRDHFHDQSHLILRRP